MAVIDENGVRRRLRIMLGSDKLVEDYIAAHGFRVDNTKIQAMRAPTEKVVEIEDPGETAADDAVFTVFVKCPSCYMTKLPSHELKSKSQQIFTDRFGMPTYHALGKYKVVDYNLISVTVCPQCLYASPDKKDFITRDPAARTREIPARLHQGELAAILAAADERASWLATLNLDPMKDILPRTRTPEAGLASYELAVLRAKIEFARNVPFSAYKMAGYTLKKAVISRTHGMDEMPHLTQSLKYYLACFERSNAPGFQFEGHVLHQVIALGMRTGQLELAGSYLGVLDRSKMRLEAGKEDAQVVSTFMRWYNAARELWADRENPDIWEVRAS
jgi:uncharacterized protein (DUF2225 family)